MEEESDDSNYRIDYKIIAKGSPIDLTIQGKFHSIFLFYLF